MEVLQLTSTPLEEAAHALLSSLEADVGTGPKGEHDLEVTFPKPFVRRQNRFQRSVAARLLKYYY